MAIAEIKLKAFTVIETLVSLLLIMITVGLCLMVFSYASKDIINSRNYSSIANNIIVELENGERDLITHYAKVDEHDVNIQVEDYQEMEFLKKITVTIQLQEKIVYRTKVLKIVEN